MQDKDLEKLIFQMLSRQNALMFDRILPSIERLQDNLGIMRRRHTERFELLEAAAADLASEIYALKTGKNIGSDSDVRKH